MARVTVTKSPFYNINKSNLNRVTVGRLCIFNCRFLHFLVAKYTKTHISIRHNRCLDGKKRTYLVTPSNFLSGKRCPKCGRIKVGEKLGKGTDQFKHELFVLIGDEYTLLNDYINTKTKVILRHNACFDGGIHEYSVTPDSFLRGNRCPKCRYPKLADKQKKSTEQFIKEIFKLVGDEYTLLDEYKNAHIYVTMRHNMCTDGGTYEYPVIPNSFLRGSRCPKCHGVHIRTFEEFRNEVFELVGSEYSILSDYINITTEITLQHNACKDGGSYEYNVRPYAFLSGARCPKCAGNQLKTTELFKEEVYELVGEEYTVLDDYVHSHIPIRMKHNACVDGVNCEFPVPPAQFLSGSRCPKCQNLNRAEKQRKTERQFKEEVFELVGDEYTVLGDYKNARTYIKMRHNDCKHGGAYDYQVTPDAFLRGSRCPRCSESKGEKRIADWLDENNIFYKREYKFDDCRHKRTLPFDFAVFKDKSLILLIEYHGGQHYKTVEAWGGIKTYESVRERDEIKREYCVKNHIPLLVIPYWEFNNISKILEWKFQ